MQDLYDTLGVSKNADNAAIKAAYRKLAMKYHPDRNAGDTEAEAKFKEVNAAYEILKDSDKRAAYDRYGHAAFEQGGNGAGDFGGFGDFAGDMGGFTDIFEHMFGHAAGGRRKPRRGNDIQVNLNLTLEDAYTGLEKTIPIPVKVSCHRCDGHGTKDGKAPDACGQCNGAGKIRRQQGPFSIEQTCPACRGAGNMINDPCADCNGSGLKKEEKNISITIPAGIDHGQRIRMSGRGEAGPHGSSAGDLYLFIHLADHAFFERDGENLHCEIPINIVDAALGTTMEIPLPTGKRVQVKIPAGTQGGTKLRLRGKGMPVMRRDRHGDLFVHTRVETPVNLSSEQRELLQKFREKMTDENNNPESSGFLTRLRKMWDELTED